MADLVEGRGSRGPKPIGFVKRFWEKVDKRSDDECWNWKGLLNTNGYPTISICNRYWLAHRMSYLIHYGKISPDLYIMHKCDNPKCVNPNHLIEGTPKQNTNDAISKHRMLIGEKNGMSKLSESDVIRIRALRNEGSTLSSLAKQYGVYSSCICKVCRKTHWKHI